MATNAPKKIENPVFYLQKLNYIHENPVRKGYVTQPEHWLWSSANPFSALTVDFLHG
jgi:putative transposase